MGSKKGHRENMDFSSDVLLRKTIMANEKRRWRMVKHGMQIGKMQVSGGGAVA